MATINGSASLTQNGLQLGTASVSVTGNTVITFADNIPENTTDFHIPADVVTADVVAVLIYGTTAVTVETEDGTTPEDTFSLAAGAPLFWVSGAGTSPITTDFSGLYVTTGAVGADGCDLTVVIVQNN